VELSIDTSTNVTGLALSRQGELVADMTWHSEFRQSVELLPALEGLLRHCRVSQRELGAVFVAVGPGGFTSLRVGLSTAKGLAFSLRIPVVGVGTLETEAIAYYGSDLPLRPMLTLRQAQGKLFSRNEIATALYEWGEQELEVLEEPQVTTLEEVVSRTQRPTLFCGEAAFSTAVLLAERLPGLALLPQHPVQAPRVRAVAWLGWRHLLQGRTDDPALLQPMYLKRPSVTMKSGLETE
jgi:tRNA threonylcarbamoyladenosine biosynthesis protein TsaB